jgi:hypothetical protein
MINDKDNSNLREKGSRFEPALQRKWGGGIDWCNDGHLNLKLISYRRQTFLAVGNEAIKKEGSSWLAFLCLFITPYSKIGVILTSREVNFLKF